ncbi:MAG: DedA family protein [Desulfuromonadaceae bacterium]|nr:DedA family protein [Desulfuromonadaceae bacterium]
MNIIVQWLLNTIGAMGYPGILLLMAMESSIIPIPSELVMPPAGYLVYQGKMNMAVVILCGTAGSLIGAYINYFVSHYLGRPLILRYGKYALIPPDKFERVERFFLRHGEISTFIGRLLPVIRHLISIPAGVAGMNHFRFALYTMLGAGLWCTILTLIGYAIGENQQLIMQYSHKALLWVILFSAALVAVYIWWQRNHRSKA